MAPVFTTGRSRARFERRRERAVYLAPAAYERKLIVDTQSTKNERRVAENVPTVLVRFVNGGVSTRDLRNHGTHVPVASAECPENT